MKVTLPIRYASAETTTVEIDDSGAVTWQGQMIGYVRKGTRTYSPKLYPGSRLVKYHKQVPCWYASPTDPNSFNRPTYDTRRDAIRYLIRKAGETS